MSTSQQQQQHQHQHQQPQHLASASLNRQLASPTDSALAGKPLTTSQQEREKAATPGSGHETPAPPTPSSTSTLTSPPILAPACELLNGPLAAPPSKSPRDGEEALVTACHNNNNNSQHLANNNINVGVSVMAGLGGVFDSLKSPFRFDERHPFRFGDEYGAAGMAGRLGESLIPKGDPMEARLQEMLRYNMDKYATQNLDTLHIARRVRELLSIHNIGQRLFAKYVLGLSQGTVSELLSKPKPWDKLTEKGRDSYRKMHSWACDENAVMLLKSLIPKKGELSFCSVLFCTVLF